ncbi:MAG: LVIVD repeat-containing protein [Paludibacteraceae bacterium]
MNKLNCIFYTLLVMILSACSNNVYETTTYKINEPVFMPTGIFRKSVKVNQESRNIEKQGKIAFYKNYMYLSEPEKGIHIIDNRNPSSPRQVGFIELIGNVDMAIKDNILYADSYIDLVWFDVSNPSSPLLSGRKEDVFPTALPIADNNFWYDYEKSMDKSKGVVIGWTVKERKDSYPAPYFYRIDWFSGGGVMMDAAGSSKGTGGNVGLTGSMSRFAIYGNYLYTVLQDQLGVFNIEKSEPAKMGDNVYVGFNVETIFSYKENLFMGTPTGMLIYSANDPLNPVYESSLQHVYGCDPVVVENDVAYVTVHSGNNCGQNNNQLIVIDVKDVKNPKAIVTYEMTKPKGLGIDNNTLFVCDEGLKVYDATNPKGIMVNQLAHFKAMEGFDVIAFDNVLMMIAEDGIYQYDYSDLKNIKPLSKIAFFN